MSRLAESLGHVLVLGERCPEGRRPVLQPCRRGEQQRLGQSFGVPCRPRQLGDLAGDGHPLAAGAGGPQRVVVRQQAAGQGARVVQSAGDRHRSFGQRPGPRPLGRDRVLQLSRQRGDHLRLGRCPRPGQGPQRRVEHGDQLGTWHGEAGAAPIQPQGDRAEELWLTGRLRPPPCLVEQVAGRDRVAGAKPQLGLRRQHLDELRRRECLAGPGHRGPRPAQMSGGLGEGDPRDVPVGRGTCPPQRGSGAGDGNGGREVMGQLGREHRAAALVPAHERLRHLPVQVETLRGRERRVDGLAVEVVDEPGRPLWVRAGAHDPRRRRLGDQLVHPGRVVAGHVGEHVGQQLGAGDRRGVQQPSGIARQQGEPSQDHLPYGHRHLVGRTAVGEQPAQFAGEERVPAAALVHHPCPPVGCGRAGGGSHQLGDLTGRQALQGHQLGAAGQDGERRGDVGAGLVRPVGTHQQQPPGTGPATEETQQVEGGGVAPLQVVEHDHDGRMAGGLGEQPPDCVEQQQPTRVIRRSLRAPRHHPEVRQHRRPYLGRDGVPQLGARVDQLAQRLGPRPPRGRLVAVPAGAPDHRGSARTDRGGEPGQQRRLAHSGLAGDQHETCPGRIRAPRPTRDRVVRGDESRQRFGPPDERRHLGIVAADGAARKLPAAFWRLRPVFWRVRGVINRHPRRTP